MLPLHLHRRTTQIVAKLTHLLLHLWQYHCHVEDLRRRIRVGRPSQPLALVIMLFLILGQLFKDKTLIMGVEHFEVRLCIVNLILSLNSIQKRLKLNEGTIFFFDENNLTHPSEVAENVVQTVMIVLLRQGSDEQYFRRTVLLQKLLGIGIYNSFRFPSVYLCNLFPFSKFLAFQGDFSKLFVDIHQIIKRAVLFCTLRRSSFRLVLGRS